MALAACILIPCALEPPVLALGAIAAAPAASPASAGDRRRLVAGWLVEHFAESDGGRLVLLSRRAGDARIQYSAAFWRGNDGRIQALLVERSDCTDGEEIGRHVVLPARAIRAMLTRLLANCAFTRPRIAAALSGFDSAYALALAWAREAEAATAAEAAAIAAQGAGQD